EVENETSPPSIFVSGRGRCRAPGPCGHRGGADLSEPAGAGDRAVRARRHDRHRRASDGTVAFGAPRPAICVENRPGGSTTIGTEAVVRAPADGYALLLVTTSSAINTTLFESRLNYNFLRDIVPIAGIFRVPNVMVVHPSVPAKTVP